MTRKQLAMIKKALRYAKEGTPMKDAYENGRDEQDCIIAAFEHAVRTSNVK